MAWYLSSFFCSPMIIPTVFVSCSNFYETLLLVLILSCHGILRHIHLVFVAKSIPKVFMSCSNSWKLFAYFDIVMPWHSGTLLKLDKNMIWSPFMETSQSLEREDEISISWTNVTSVSYLIHTYFSKTVHLILIVPILEP